MKNIALFLAAALILAACNNNRKATAQTAPASMAMPMSLETIAVKKTNPQVKLKLPGEIIADQKVAIYAKVNSYVKSLKVDIGSTVSKGQVILELEAPEIGLQIASARSKWRAQEAIYAATKASYERVLQASGTEGAVSGDALDQITAKKLADEAQLEVAKSAYQELRAIEDYLVIRAPFSGVITERNVDLGTYVGPAGKGSDKPLLVLQTADRLRLALSVPEANAPFLNLGDTIHFAVKSLPQKKYFALIARKSGALDSRLRSERIEVDVLNGGRELKPLMVAEATIPLRAKSATFFIPKPALVESNLGVYVVKVENGKTKKISVIKGRALPDQVEVFGELSEGDLILKKASEEITEGMWVPAAAK